MRQIFMVIAGTVVLVGAGGADVSATTPIGPFCLSTLPFRNVFVWFFDVHGGNQLAGTGRDLELNRAQTVTGFVSDGNLHVSFTTSPGTTGNPIMGGGVINLDTATGLGRCHQVNGTGGCGAGTDFTFAVVPCPSGALE